MTVAEEIADLTALVTSPGWRALEQFAGQEFTTKINTHLESAANDTDDLMALQKLRQVMAARRAVERVLQWPHERIAALQHQGPKAVGWARGGL